MLRLKRPLRRTSDIDPGDALAAKRALAERGFYDPPPFGFHPYPDEELWAGVTALQKATGETPDGEMLPGGPTEAALNRLPASRPPIPKEEPNDYRRLVAKGLVRPEEAISDSETWAQSVERSTGMRPTPAAAGALSVAAAAALAESGWIVLPGLLGGLGLLAAQDALNKRATGRPEERREALPPEKLEPMRGPSPAEIGRLNEKLSKPLPGPAPEPIENTPEIFPIPDPAKPEILIFPDVSDLLPDTTILESRWGNDKTKAELHGLNDAILGQHPDWDLRGGVPFGKEYWFPGPGYAFLDKKGKRGDGRPGGRWADLTYELPDGSLVVVQHADVDKYGNIEQHELDAARSISRPRVTVYIVPKQWQLDRIRRRAEESRRKE